MQELDMILARQQIYNQKQERKVNKRAISKTNYSKKAFVGYVYRVFLKTGQFVNLIQNKQ